MRPNLGRIKVLDYLLEKEQTERILLLRYPSLGKLHGVRGVLQMGMYS